jgi:hypothetical protein
MVFFLGFVVIVPLDYDLPGKCLLSAATVSLIGHHPGSL